MMVHSRYGGSGLGLFICRSECVPGSAMMTGGRIEVVSRPGEGSGECTPERHAAAAYDNPDIPSFFAPFQVSKSQTTGLLSKLG